VKIDRLKLFRARVDDPPGPESDAGEEREHEVELLNRKEMRGSCTASCGGAATLRRTTSDCGRRNWPTARSVSGWPMLPPRAAGAPAGAPARRRSPREWRWRRPPGGPTAEVLTGTALAGRCNAGSWERWSGLLAGLFAYGVRYASRRGGATGRQPRCWTPPRTALGLRAGGCSSASARPNSGFSGTTVTNGICRSESRAQFACSS
jgi:hypothetical protein